MTTTTQPLAAGAIARLTRDVTQDEATWARPTRKGETFTVEEYVRENHPDGDGGPAFYIGSTRYGCGDASVPADAVEVVMSPTAAAARRIPTAEAVRSALVSALLMDADGFECTEARPDGKHGVEVYGETTDGLAFAFTVEITSLYEADL